jgi:hypothetical protein
MRRGVFFLNSWFAWRTATFNQDAQEKPDPAPTGAQLLLPESPTQAAALMSRFTFFPLHWGQAASSSSPEKTSLSKQLSHVSHLYSKIGIHSSWWVQSSRFRVKGLQTINTAYELDRNPK